MPDIDTYPDIIQPDPRHAAKVAASREEGGAVAQMEDVWRREQRGYLDDSIGLKLKRGTDIADRMESGNVKDEADWPEPMDGNAFYGPAGDFVHLVLPQTESDPQALLVAFLVGFGAIVGGQPFYQVEDTRHAVNEFAVIVGKTAKARKGTATDRAMRILERASPEFMATRRRSGLSSGEGLIQAVRDPREEDVQVKTKDGSQRFERQVVDTGETDKRLLVVESEFSNVLQQLNRDGNILSAILRDAWDGKALRILARSNRDSCLRPHISAIGNITIEEVRQRLSTNDKANGFGNRILWVCAKRSKHLPHGGRPLDQEKLDSLVSSLRSSLEAATRIHRVQFDAESARAWERVYDVLSNETGGIFGSLTARAEAHVIRLATLYSLLDCSSSIRVAHLRAATAVWGYCEESVRVIFGDALGDETADAILRMLKNTPDGMAQTAINRAFHSHKPAAELERALAFLQRKRRVSSEQAETGGGPATIWKLSLRKE